MLAPGAYTLLFQEGDFSITQAGTYVGEWTYGLDGIRSAAVQLDFRPSGNGPFDVSAYVQTSLDEGNTVIDIACVHFTAGGRQVLAFAAGSAAPFVPADAGLSAGTVVNGVLGTVMRVKLVTTGNLQNSSLGARLVAA